jgi:hypothetical protein
MAAATTARATAKASSLAESGGMAAAFLALCASAPGIKLTPIMAKYSPSGTAARNAPPIKIG